MINGVAVVLGVVAVACLLVGLGLAYFELAPVTVGMALYAGSGLIGLCAVLAAIVVVFTTRNLPSAVTGLAGAAPLIIVIVSLAGALRYPSLNDVTTDLSHPPEFEAAAQLPDNAGRDMSFPSEFGALITEHYPDVQPLTLSMAVDAAYARALETAEAQGWEIIEQRPQSHVFEAVSVTPLFRFRDDLVVRVSESGAGSRVDVRSKSRVGRSDLGANAARIRGYLQALESGS